MLEQVDAWLASIYGPRRWLVATEVVPAVGGTVRRLRGWGAPRCFGIAVRDGVGAPPDPEDCELRVLGAPPLPMMEAIHAAEDALRDLPEDVQRAVDAFDPERRACVIGAFYSDGRPVAGRRFWGARPAAWQALEDKCAIDRVWDEAGVPRAPAEVVPLDRAAEVAARLDQGLGTVWAGDADRGFHGGATYTVHVTDAASADRAAERLRGRCTRARVMPFLDGIPCSMHGIVFPDHVIVLRPAEMVVLRGGRQGFVYLRAGTCWDPPPHRRDEMRARVRRVGEHLRASVGYRGAFTVDGVMTAQGFRPTELNPRVGAALGMMAPLPFQFLSDALVEGLVPPVSPVALEAELLAIADARRVGSIGTTFAAAEVRDERRPLVFDGGVWRDAREGEPPDATFAIGPGPAGAFANLSMDPDRLPVGRSLGPRAAAWVAWLDEHYGAGLGPAWPAPEAVDV